MDTLAPVLDWRPETPVSGYHRFHPDVSLNFQCNRWVQWIGADAHDADAHDEVSALAAHANSYPEWIDGFLDLAQHADSCQRPLAGAYYSRAAEFFMAPDDPRRPTIRDRFLTQMRNLYQVHPIEVPYRGQGRYGVLPTYDLLPPRTPIDTIIVFGGFDSYIEEFLPLMTGLRQAGYRVIAFDGPGQGSALEDHHLPITPAWEKPVGAVLDHLGIDHDVTAIGVSLGGGLVIRAAAFEPRLRRVIAFDILDDELEVAARQVGRGAATILRVLLSLRARAVINAVAGWSAHRKPISAWALQQGMHITGTDTAYDFLTAARATQTHTISGNVTADVLLLAGADDHYVPLHQLHRQATALTKARSVTTRVFTCTEQASNHCQVGNFGLALRFSLAWLESLG